MLTDTALKCDRCTTMSLQCVFGVAPSVGTKTKSSHGKSKSSIALKHKRAKKKKIAASQGRGLKHIAGKEQRATKAKVVRQNAALRKRAHSNAFPNESSEDAEPDTGREKSQPWRNHSHHETSASPSKLHSSRQHSVKTVRKRTPANCLRPRLFDRLEHLSEESIHDRGRGPQPTSAFEVFKQRSADLFVRAASPPQGESRVPTPAASPTAGFLSEQTDDKLPWVSPTFSSSSHPYSMSTSDFLLPSESLSHLHDGDGWGRRVYDREQSSTESPLDSLGLMPSPASLFDDLSAGSSTSASAPSPHSIELGSAYFGLNPASLSDQKFLDHPSAPSLSMGFLFDPYTSSDHMRGGFA